MGTHLNLISNFHSNSIIMKPNIVTQENNSNHNMIIEDIKNNNKQPFSDAKLLENEIAKTIKQKSEVNYTKEAKKNVDNIISRGNILDTSI